MSIQELRKEQARNLRYKKPIAKGLNWQDIWDDLYEMYEGCTLVIWFMDDDKETLLESLNDDESEAEEYKMCIRDRAVTGTGQPFYLWQISF